MAAGNKPKYYLVEASVLPEIFAKVIEAKAVSYTHLTLPTNSRV